MGSVNLVTLRYQFGWLAIGWSLVIAVIISSLMSPPPATESLFELPFGDKIAHAVAYLVIMGWFAQIYHAPTTRWGYVIGFLLLGIVLEILQGWGGTRVADWTDVVANSVGIGIAWILTRGRLALLLVYIESKI